MSAGSKVVVSAKGLAAAYDGRIVWEGADFQIKSGQLATVLGPNGAGKTTLFRLILGLMPPAGGSLKVFGQQPSRGNQRIGYVPQRHHIDSDMRLEALELVSLGYEGNRWGVDIRSASASRELALKALAEVDAEDLAHRPLGTLSGGELQRVFIAQAMISQPDLLLLDEPLANLDIRRQTGLVNLISRIAKTHQMSVLLIAHDINPLLSVMDEVIYMARGRVATGRPAQVINSKTLSQLYAAPVEVLKDSRGRLAVIGTEEAAHPHAE